MKCLSFAVGLWLLAVCAVTPRIEAQPPAAGKRYAVLVGVEQYDHPKLREPAPLKYSVDDVVALGIVLKAAGYEVTVLCDDTGAKDVTLLPTRANIEKRLQSVLRECKRTDTVLVAFAGHGLQFAGTKDAYFCPQDARPFASEVATLLSISRVYDELDKSFAGVKVVLVDACRNDPDPGRGRGLDADSAPPPPKGVAALFSCSAGQKAFEHDELRHGVFFHHVLEGFKGEAANRRGDVTFDGLSAYIRESVPDTIQRLLPEREQSPNLKADLVGVPPVLAHSILRAGTIRDDNGLKLKLVWCPPGQLKTENSNTGEKPDGIEKPLVSVHLAQGFWIGQTEVTQGQMSQVLGIRPWKGSKYAKDGPDYAASSVDSNQATEFCETLTKEERDAGRLDDAWVYCLPSELEWEYACRAGTETIYSFGNNASALDEYAWWGGIRGEGNAQSEQYVHLVGQKKPNRWGLHDMHGNVFEWCRDIVSASMDGIVDRPLRGGSWYQGSDSCRCAQRWVQVCPVDQPFNGGLRVALCRVAKPHLAPALPTPVTPE